MNRSTSMTTSTVVVTRGFFPSSRFWASRCFSAFFVLCCVFGLLAGTAGAANAATDVWIATGTTANFNTASNWSLGTVPTSADTAVFPKDATLAHLVTVTATTPVGGVNVGDPYTFSVGTGFTFTPGAINDDATGAGSFIKAGAGTLALTAAGTFTGGFTLQDGPLTVSNAGAFGTGAVNIGNTATAPTGTISISTASSLQLTNAVFNLNQNFTFGASGSNGFILGSSTAGSPSTINVSKSLTVSGAGNSTNNPTFGSASTITNSSAGAATLTIAGGTKVTISSKVTDGANGTLALILGDAGGTALTNGTNSYTGGTQIKASTTSFVPNSLGPSGPITFNGGILQYSFTPSNNQDISARIVTVATFNVAIDSNGNSITFASPISGAGGVTKSGGGSLTLSSAANSFSGAVNIQNGVLRVAAISALGTGTTINMGTGSTIGTLVYTGTGETTNKVVNFAIGNAAVGATGGGGIIDQSGTGLLKFSGNTTATGQNVRTFTLQGSTLGAGEFAGAIINNSIANTTSLVKTGTNTWTLSGPNTYTGTTLVNNGNLSVTGSIASSSLTTVASGATLSGTGTIGATTIVANGTNAPGVAGPGVQTFTGNYTNAGKLAIDINSTTAGTGAGTGYDQVSVAGNANISGASLNLTLGAGYTPALGDSFTIINNTGTGTLTGTFTQGSTITQNGTTFSISYGVGANSNNVVLTVTAVPAVAPSVVISEFRASGPQGESDEFIELANVTGSDIDLTGWKLTANGVLTTIPMGKTIKAGGHFLIANAGDSTTTNPGFSLGTIYAFATPDVTYTGDFALGSTLVLSNQAGASVDTVSNLSATASPTSSTSEYSFVRRMESGFAAKTGSDTSDFNLVDINATVSTVGATGVGPLTAPRLGAPGPQSTLSPIQRNGQISLVPINAATVGTPSDGRYASKGGFLDNPNGRQTLRRTLTNNTGAPVTKLRLRIVAATSGTTTPTSGIADLRAITSAGVTLGGAKKVLGMTLEAPSTPTVAPSGFGTTTAADGNGGGLNSSWTVDLSGTFLLADGVTTATGNLPNGSSINVEFLFAIVQNGTYRFVVDTELLP